MEKPKLWPKRKGRGGRRGANAKGENYPWPEPPQFGQIWNTYSEGAMSDRIAIPEKA